MFAAQSMFALWTVRSPASRPGGISALLLEKGLYGGRAIGVSLSSESERGWREKR